MIEMKVILCVEEKSFNIAWQKKIILCRHHLFDILQTKRRGLPEGGF